MKILYENHTLTESLHSADPQHIYLQSLRAAKAARFDRLAAEASAFASSAPVDLRIEQDDLLQGHIHLWTQRLHFNVRFPGDRANRQLFSALFADADQVVFSVAPENGLLHPHFIFCL